MFEDKFGVLIQVEDSSDLAIRTKVLEIRKIIELIAKGEKFSKRAGETICCIHDNDFPGGKMVMI